MSELCGAPRPIVEDLLGRGEWRCQRDVGHDGEHGALIESDICVWPVETWRGRLSWHTEVTVIAEHGAFVWALDDLGEPYTLRADCVERINP